MISAFSTLWLGLHAQAVPQATGPTRPRYQLSSSSSPSKPSSTLLAMGTVAVGGGAGGAAVGIRDSSSPPPSPPLIPSPFASSPRTLPAVTIDPRGTMYSTEILKRQLADELKLPLRDLRIVDPSFPNQIQATFIARPNVILFTLENIKVVVKHNEALVFNPLLPEVREFVPALQLQIQQAYRDGSSIGSDDTAPTSMRFEHVVIEAALNVVCSNLFQVGAVKCI